MGSQVADKTNLNSKGPAAYIEQITPEGGDPDGVVMAPSFAVSTSFSVSSMHCDSNSRVSLLTRRHLGRSSSFASQESGESFQRPSARH
jgi:hypothetical protein